MILRRSILAAICTATLCVLAATAAVAQQVTLPPGPSPDFDVAKVCRPQTEYRPVVDWTKWDGTFRPEAASEMVDVAPLYYTGTSVLLRNRELARRMMQSLADNSPRWSPEAKRWLGFWYADRFSTSFNPNLAMRLLTEAANQGDAAAAAKLGSVYFLGRPVAQDLVKAEGYFKQGAAGGVASSELGLAQIYAGNPGLAPSPDAARAYAQRALGQWYAQVFAGDCSQIWAIGSSFGSFGGVIYDPAKAAAWFAAGVRNGDRESTYALAIKYLNGEGVPLDRNKAIELFELASKEGKVNAMTIGASLLLGEASDDARTRAIGLLELAAEHSVPEALDLLASVANGDYGGTPDLALRAKYLIQEATLPDASPELFMTLGRSYERGEGLPRNERAAFDAYSKAADAGLPDGYLAMYELSISGHVQSPEHPLFYLRAAAGLGSGEAMTELATAYRCGVEVDPNETVASLWDSRAAMAGDAATLLAMANAARAAGPDGISSYVRDIRRAARNGDGQSMILLSQVYATGTGVKRSQQSADRWRDLALGNAATRRDALIALADIALAGGDSGTALVYLGQADPSDPVVAYKLSRVLAALGGSSEKSVSLLVAAANGGNPSAMLKLAQMGLTPQETGGKSGAEWLRLAEAAGSTEALIIDASTTSDTARAHQLLDDAIALNSCDAKSLLKLSAGLTDLNYRADAIPGLVDRARSLKPGDPDAMYLLAEQTLALSGQTSSAEAFDLLSRSADAGYLPAMREAAAYYRDGLFTKKDVPLAARLFYTTALAGNKTSLTSLLSLVASAGPTEMQLRDLLAQSLEPGAVDQATGIVPQVLKAAASVDASFAGEDVAWLRDRAKDGSSKAMLKLADVLSASNLPAASQESAHWLYTAALSGDQEAFARYALVLQLGIGVSKDSKQADYWLRRAQGDAATPLSSGG